MGYVPEPPSGRLGRIIVGVFVGLMMIVLAAAIGVAMVRYLHA